MKDARLIEEPIIPSAWGPFLEEWGALNALQGPLKNLRRALAQNEVVYPESRHLFRALEAVPPEGVRVVLLGQDPYPGAGLATGLSFAVPAHVPAPPSLLNIAKALEWDRQACVNEGQPQLMEEPIRWLNQGQGSGSLPDLPRWAEQGVLLLNETLTVRAGAPGSHRSWGWGRWTAKVLEGLAQTQKPMVWMLWGKEAQKHRNPRVHCLEAVHPSPLSAYRGFVHCRHFSQANQLLQAYL
ncbi:MAG: uracil-DNA glycosylase [Cytophagia bacterium]|nr:uracil-DNA glycosylase [Cytophagia bacterium]